MRVQMDVPEPKVKMPEGVEGWWWGESLKFKLHLFPFSCTFLYSTKYNIVYYLFSASHHLTHLTAKIQFFFIMTNILEGLVFLLWDCNPVCGFKLILKLKIFEKLFFNIINKVHSLLICAGKVFFFFFGSFWKSTQNSLNRTLKTGSEERGPVVHQPLQALSIQFIDGFVLWNMFYYYYLSDPKKRNQKESLSAIWCWVF